MHTPQRGPDDGATANWLGYFMVRIRRTWDDPPGEFAGVIEQLGTSEKREFRTTLELARVVDDWTTAGSQPREREER